MPKARDTGRGKEPRGRKRQGAIACGERLKSFRPLFGFRLGLRLREPIPLPQRLRLLGAAKRIERFGGGTYRACYAGGELLEARRCMGLLACVILRDRAEPLQERARASKVALSCQQVGEVAEALTLLPDDASI